MARRPCLIEAFEQGRDPCSIVGSRMIAVQAASQVVTGKSDCVRRSRSYHVPFGTWPAQRLKMPRRRSEFFNSIKGY